MSKKEIVKLLNDALEMADINPGDTVLVHSSLKRILKKLKSEYNLLADPELIFEIILNKITASGTLVLPLFNFDFPTTKIFDIRSTPSQMGALTEIGRLYPSAVRTGHPIYSFAAIGKNSSYFKNLYNYSGYGADSPFNIIHKLNGKICVIGLDDQNSMTSYHYVEECYNITYRYHKKFVGNYTDWDGSFKEREFGLFVRDIELGVQTDVNRMGELLWEKGLYKGQRYEQDFGIRSINFTDFYTAVSDVILRGDAINYLYSIRKD